MKSVDVKSPLGREFDPFLFTALGEDENGLALSVVSLFARLNLDPWQEAQDLAAMPAEGAARRLSFSLDSLLDPRLRRSITEATVPRLLALLPKPASAAVPAPTGSAAPVAAPYTANRLGTILLITSVIVLLGSRFFAAHDTAAIQPGVVPGPAAHPLPSQPLPAYPAHKD